MKLTGKWVQLNSLGIKGDFILTCNGISFNGQPNENFTAELVLVYSDASPYEPGQTKTIKLEGFYTVNNRHRIALRQTEFNTIPYYTMTLRSRDKKQWKGHLTRNGSTEFIKLSDIAYDDINGKIDEIKTDVDDENEFVVTI